MASNIEWTDETWNPWYGCKKVSPGCQFCYMYREQEQYGGEPNKVKKSKTKFNFPKSKLFRENPGLKIFTSSWTDFFIDEADEWRPEAWQIIKETPNNIYQILTKRAHRIPYHLPDDWGDGYPNVWIGISAENQQMYDTRVREFTRFKAAVKFVSFEPLLGPIDITSAIHSRFKVFDWGIIGGESGNSFGYYIPRPCELEWVRLLITDMKKMDIPVFNKQLGTHLARFLGVSDQHGRDINQWPDDLKIREFPNG